MNPVMEQLPESKRTSEVESALEKLGVKDMSSLADALVKGSSLLGEVDTLRGQVGTLESKLEKMIELPGDDPQKEKEFYSKIGVPSNKDEYSVGDEKLKSVFLEAKIPKKSAEILTSKLKMVEEEKAKELESQKLSKLSEVKESLKDQWRFVEKGVETLFPGEESAPVREKVLSDPDIVKGFATVGRLATEKATLFSSTPGGGGKGTLYPTMESKGIK